MEVTEKQVTEERIIQGKPRQECTTFSSPPPPILMLGYWLSYSQLEQNFVNSFLCPIYCWVPKFHSEHLMCLLFVCLFCSWYSQPPQPNSAEAIETIAKAAFGGKWPSLGQLQRVTLTHAHLLSRAWLLSLLESRHHAHYFSQGFSWGLPP